MQEHRQEPPQNPPQEHYALPASAHPTSGLNLPDSASLLEVRLEAYLDAICTLMPADVPALAIAEMRREMENHLQTALVAMQELGYTPEESVVHAFAQFGEPQVVAKHWRQEWEKTLTHTDTGSFWISLKLALQTWTVTHALFLGIWVYCVMQWSLRLVSSWPLFVSYALLYGPQIGAGAFIGMRVRRPVFCALLAYMLTLPIVAGGVLLYIVFMRDWEQAHNIQGLGTSAYPLLTKIAFGSYFYTFMVLPLGFASACVTALGRRIRTFTRRQIAN